MCNLTPILTPFFDFCRFLIKSDEILKSRTPSQNGHSRHSIQLDKFHIMKTRGEC